MPSNPLVSVILPVYNGRRVLAEAIDSILNQTHRDLELVIVDDGSTDGSIELLQGYERSDSRVVLHLHAVNQGITASLNDLARAARGEFVAVMNQDDVSVTDRLERQVVYLRRREDIAAVGSAARIINEQGTPTILKRYPASAGLTAWSLFFLNSLLHPSTMIRRSALESAGYYPVGYGSGTEDYALWVRLSKRTRIANIPDVLLHYRVWEANVTTAAWAAQESEATRIVREHASDVLGAAVSTDQAYALRGLSTDRYPQDLETIKDLADLIDRLRRAFLAAQRLPPAEVNEVNRDAGVRLWLLAAVAARQWPRAATSLVAAATRVSPPSVLTFAGKVARRLTAGLSQRLRKR
jgi:glycosyltransferase involved in cell wall biosynthesis